MKTFNLDKSALLADIKGLLKIKSVNGDCGEVTEKAPLGEGIYNAIEYVLELGRKFGFRTKNLDGCCGYVEMGEGDEMIAVLAHVDTVGVEPEGWCADPFDGTIIDGKMYGRGVGDDKGPALVTLYAMKALKDSGIKLDKRIRLIVGGDEEGGAWRCMNRYKETEETPTCAFTPDAEYPTTFAEKGILRICIKSDLAADVKPISIRCGKQINVVPAYAAATVDGVVYEETGVASHAMSPHLGVNALLKLCEKLRTQGVVHPFLELAKIANAEDLDVAFTDEPSGKLTFNPAIADVNDLHAELSCDLRVPVTVDKDQVLANIQKHIAPLGFTVEAMHFSAPLYVKKDSHLITTLQRVYKEITGDNAQPVSTGGGTYARAFDNAVAFGALFPNEEVTFHQTNEYWAVDSIEKNYQIIANALLELL